MGVISRINDLLLANAHHAIDQAENPEVMLKQVIRDMDRNIYEARAAVVSAVAGEKQLAAQAKHHRSVASDMERKAESALNAGREDPRQMLARKSITTESPRTLNVRTPARAKSARAKAQLDMLHAKRADACRRKDVLIARQRAAEARSRVTRSLAAATVGDTSGETLARMQQRVSEMEAEAAAVTEVLEEPKQPDKDIAEIETAAQVDDALAALKARLAGGGPASSIPVNA